VILNACTRYLILRRRALLDDAPAARILAAAQEMGSQALRVLAVASRPAETFRRPNVI
jgi:magnesium-transporting ATPase (P-type)